MQDDAGGPNGEKGAVGDDAPLAGRNLGVVDEGAGIAVGVAQDSADAHACRG